MLFPAFPILSSKTITFLCSHQIFYNLWFRWFWWIGKIMFNKWCQSYIWNFLQCCEFNMTKHITEIDKHHAEVPDLCREDVTYDTWPTPLDHNWILLDSTNTIRIFDSWVNTQWTKHPAMTRPATTQLGFSNSQLHRTTSGFIMLFNFKLCYRRLCCIYNLKYIC